MTVPVTQTKTARTFTVTGKFNEVVQKIFNLRPVNVPNDFLMNFQKGKCTCQRIGVNKIAGMSQQITKFLKLPEAERYTGHSSPDPAPPCWSTFKRHGGWKSTSVAEGYIDDSLKNKADSAQKIHNAVQQSSSTNITSNTNSSTSTGKINSGKCDVGSSVKMDFKSAAIAPI